MSSIYYTREPVDTANANRDGTGTLVLLATLEDKEYIDTIVCEPLGTNAATEGFILASNGQGLGNDRNNVLIGRESLQATTAGSPAAGDRVVFEVEAWVDKGWELYCGVHDAQAAGRQFAAYADESYAIRRYVVHNVTRVV